jgi:hypothetical protein
VDRGLASRNGPRKAAGGRVGILERLTEGRQLSSDGVRPFLMGTKFGDRSKYSRVAWCGSQIRKVGTGQSGGCGANYWPVRSSGVNGNTRRHSKQQVFEREKSPFERIFPARNESLSSPSYCTKLATFLLQHSPRNEERKGKRREAIGKKRKGNKKGKT